MVLRHATAASGAGLPSDHARPLTRRGSEEALSTARLLVEAGWVPERVLYSDAARTTETWWCMAETLGKPPSTELPGFYGAGIDALLAAVKRLPPDHGTVLALGHNPGWSDAIAWLADVQVRLAPGDAALLEGRGERWSEALGRGAMTLRGVVRPVVS